VTVVRGAVGLGGLVIAVTGIYKIIQGGGSSVIETAKWLIFGNLIHDAIVVPIALVLGAVAVRVLPTWARLPVATGFVVLATTTIMAIPVLSGMGEDSTNPSLLPRDYVGGWLVLALLTVLGVAVGCWWQRRRLSVVGGRGGAPPGQADGARARGPDGIRAARAGSERPSSP
jgi:hypothetical protein